MQKLCSLTAAFLMLPLLAQAQVAAPAVEPAPLPAGEEEVLPQLPPSEITPEQKIGARRSLQKTIQTSAVNSSPNERRKIIDAVSTLEKMRIRRENLNRTPGEKINYDKPNVNANDRKDVQNYLQKTFVDPLDASFATPNQE